VNIESVPPSATKQGFSRFENFYTAFAETCGPFTCSYLAIIVGVGRCKSTSTTDL